MRVGVVHRGNLVEELRADVERMKGGVTRAAREATRATQLDMRARTSAALGPRVANAWRSVVYTGRAKAEGNLPSASVVPSGKASLRPSGHIWSRAPNIIAGAVEATVIRAKRKRMLALPTLAAGRLPNGRAPTPAEFMARTGLNLVPIFPRHGRGGFLVAENARLTKGDVARFSKRRGGSRLTAIIYTLTPVVRPTKRLDMEAPADNGINILASKIVAELAVA